MAVQNCFSPILYPGNAPIYEVRMPAFATPTLVKSNIPEAMLDVIVIAAPSTQNAGVKSRIDTVAGTDFFANKPQADSQIA